MQAVVQAGGNVGFLIDVARRTACINASIVDQTMLGPPPQPSGSILTVSRESAQGSGRILLDRFGVYRSAQIHLVGGTRES